jgi:hypothetical protein
MIYDIGTVRDRISYLIELAFYMVFFVIILSGCNERVEILEQWSECKADCSNEECSDDVGGGSCESFSDDRGFDGKSEYGDCDKDMEDECETDLKRDSVHCSDYSNTCGENAICNNGRCECIEGYGNCDGDWSDGCEKRISNRYMWSKGLRGYGNSVEVDKLGNIYIAGNFSGSSISPDKANISSLYLVKFDMGGNYIWSRRFDENVDYYVSSLYIDYLGNIYLHEKSRPIGSQVKSS